jgi:hypothetical protein
MMIMDMNAEQTKQQFAFFAAWRKITESQPKLFELVVIKSFAGTMDWDWLEPASDRMYFAENFGPTEYWMTAADFQRLAPTGVAEHLRPVDEESNTRRLERLQKVTGVAETVLEYAPNEYTFIDLDAVLERQMTAPTLTDEPLNELKFPVIDTDLPEVPVQFGFDHPNA